jgi:hypothetical protein
MERKNAKITRKTIKTTILVNMGKGEKRVSRVPRKGERRLSMEIYIF